MREHTAETVAYALVTATDEVGHRWVLLIERGDGRRWALPGGPVDELDRKPRYAALRELAEETGLYLPDETWIVEAPRYVPDPRASDEAYVVAVLCRTHLGSMPRNEFPAVEGAHGAASARWLPADSYYQLVEHMHRFGRKIFSAHGRMLVDFLGIRPESGQPWA